MPSDLSALTDKALIAKKFLVIKKQPLSTTTIHQPIVAAKSSKWSVYGGVAGNSNGAVFGGSAKYQINDNSSMIVSGSHAGSYSHFGSEGCSSASITYKFSI